MPQWVNVLQIAEKWGVPPWVVNEARKGGENGRWYWRQVEWDKAQDKRVKVESRKTQQRTKHGI